MNRTEKMERLLDDLAPLVDGDREAQNRHADLLAEDDEARDIKHEAREIAEQIAKAGADYAPPADFETRLMAALDGRGERRVAPTETMPSAPRPSASTRTPETKAPSTPTAKKGGRLVFLGLIGVAAAAAFFVMFTPSEQVEPRSTQNGDMQTPVIANATSARITTIARASSDASSTGIEIRNASGSWQSANADTIVNAGESIRTDARTRVRLVLSDDSEMVLNHSTELRFDREQPRRFELPEGEVLADVAHLDVGPNLTITVPTGRVEVIGTKFVLSAMPDAASVRVTRGAVRVHGSAGQSREVKEGEEGVLRRESAPQVAPVMELARALAWADLENHGVMQDQSEATLPGIGSLRARRPGEREDRERPLGLARHDVRVRIVGNVARTEIEEVFRNDSDQVLEGIYRFPLPSDAQIARLALDVDGAMVEGAFVARERAQRIWRGVIRNATAVNERRPNEEFIWVPGPWRDPALLEWQRGGQFELRIFPIPAHGERRVVIAYTQVISPRTEGRRYVYPLAHSNDDSLRVGEFSVDVRVANAERAVANGYELATTPEGDATRLRLSERGFRPNGDLVIDYKLSDGERELSFWTYQGAAAAAPAAQSRDQDREVIDLQRRIASDDRGYVAFALRPRLPPRSQGQSRDYVITLDSSQSMVGERWERALRLALGIISEMDRRDRFTVLACDYECRSMEGTAEGARMRTPSATEVQAVGSWLERIEPAGASDLIATMRAVARRSRDSARQAHVLYIGDGIASVGHRAAGALAAEAGRITERERVSFTTVGIGSDADSVTLSAIARAGGGHYVPFVPGQRAALAALSVLETTYGVSLRDARLTLPDGLVEVAPATLPTIRAGEEVIVTARMARSEVDGEVVLRGTVGGEAFEQRYPVRLVPSTNAGNLFVPTLWAARTIEQLELDNRGENEARVVALSKAYSVMSRATSLLVLESEAMFRAFGIDRVEQVAQWTGEEDIESGGTEGSIGDADMIAGAAEAAQMGIGSGSGMESMRSMGGAAAPRESAAAPRARAETAAPLRRTRAAAPAAAPPVEQPSADMSRDDFEAQWSRPSPVTTPPQPRPGQWMRRVWVRVGEIRTDGTPSFREQEQARIAEESLRQQPDSRDRTRAAVRALSRAGNLERALELAEAWFARDRLDVDALVARADLLARLGRSSEALRLLTGVVDLRPDDVALQTRLASAFERSGDEARACAHRVALAEIRKEDAATVANAVRCERGLAHRELADLLLGSVREERVRSRASSLANAPAESRTPRGELMIEASWPGGDDIDVALIAPDGSRLSWMGGRTTIVGSDVRSSGRETLGLRTASAGQYLVEVTRTTPNAEGTLRGTLRIRALDETRTIPFVIGDEEHQSVARVVVRRESRLEPVR